MAERTFAAVSGRSAELLLMTRETVWYDTPASRATSRMLGARPVVSGMSVSLISRLIAGRARLRDRSHEDNRRGGDRPPVVSLRVRGRPDDPSDAAQERSRAP